MRNCFLLMFSIMLCKLSICQQWTTSGADIYNANSGNVGIGTTAPGQKLEINGIMRIKSGSSLGRNYLQVGAYDASTDNFGYISSGGQTNGTGLKLEVANGDNSTAGTTVVTILNNGTVGIGTTNTYGYKLAVNGSAIFTQATVKLYSNWPDYVFRKNYKLLPLKDLETYISRNNHLPNIPAASDVQSNGINLGDMNAKLLEKIEELTLYMIELKKENEEIKKENKEIKQQLKRVIKERA